MKTKKYNFYSDAGHGWLRVPLKELKTLDIDKDISRCSYIRGDFAYLEEDGDLQAFVEAQEKAGVKVTYREFISDKSSKIRNYQSYPAKPYILMTSPHVRGGFVTTYGDIIGETRTIYGYGDDKNWWSLDDKGRPDYQISNEEIISVMNKQIGRV